MANGKKCPECGTQMYADVEEHQPRGTYVTYVCRAGGCPSVQRGFPAKFKEFESK